MDNFQKRGKIVLGLPVVLMLSGCWGSEPDCDSADTRASLIKTVSADTSNPLVKYAADQSEAVKNKLSQAKTDAEKSSILEEAVRGASYRLSERMITNSKSKIKGKVSCSGMMNATVADSNAEKKIDFEVEKTPEGTMSVWVSPFKFEPPPDPSKPSG